MHIGTWQKCPVCKESDFSGKHRCKPVWEVCDADDREWEMVYGRDAADAAEMYCARRDPFNEYGTVSASRTVLVRPVDREGHWSRFVVLGETQPIYTAVSQPHVGDE